MIRSLERGFAPIIAIAVVALLVLGGGAYYYKASQKSVETEMDEHAREHEEEGTKGSFQELLATGEDMHCSVTSIVGEDEFLGELFISADGKLRGDVSSDGVISHIIIDSDTTYAWSGNVGTKIKNDTIDANASSQGEAGGLSSDTEVYYHCEDWQRDESKFSTPSGIEFLDADALMRMSEQFNGRAVPSQMMPQE